MKHLAYIFLLSILLVSCGTQEQLAKNNPSPKKELTEAQRLRFDKKFFEAQKQKALGNWEDVVKALEACLSTDETNDAVYYELSNAYLELGDLNSGIMSGRMAAELDPQNKWYHLHLISIYEATQQYDLQAEQYEILLKNEPGKIEYMYDLAIVYLRLNDMGSALKMYDEMEKSIGINEEISLQKKLIYLRQNKLDKAVGEMEKLVEWKPNEVRYYLYLAELYANNGEEEKALEVYNQAIAVDPNNGIVNLALGDYYYKTGSIDQAFENYEKAFSDGEIELDHKVKVFIELIGKSDLDSSLLPKLGPLAVAIESAHPSDAKTYALKGDYLLREEKKLEAREAFRKSVELGGNLYLFWSEILILNLELEDYDALASEGDQAIDLFPSQPSTYIMTAFGYFQIDEYQECVDRCKAGLDYAAGNKFLMVQFYSTMGDAYHQLDQHEESDESYDKCLALDPENETVLNNYAYYLSLRGEKLEKAKEMSAKSNALSPDNDTFEDTYAWVLFMSGEYEDALIWIEKALEHGSAKSGTVVEHYGDILFKLGRVDDALIQWKKADELGGGSDGLKQKLIDKSL